MGVCCEPAVAKSGMKIKPPSVVIVEALKRSEEKVRESVTIYLVKKKSCTCKRSTLS